MSHLWEVKHSYYCSESNYYASRDKCVFEYKSWQDFIAEWSDSDLDYNLVFRWDWREEDEDGNPNFKGDVNYRNGKLYFHWMLRRKGIFHTTITEVCRADEPAVIEFLRPRWEYLKALWSPLDV